MSMKSLLIKITLLLTLLMPVAMVSRPAYAADCTTAKTNQEAIQQGANGAAGNVACPGVDASKTAAATSLQTTITNVLNVLSLVVGILALIMIVVAGARYVTSGGKQESVTAAKNTLLYAVVGLVVVALSQAIIHFVLKTFN